MLTIQYQSHIIKGFCKLTSSNSFHQFSNTEMRTNWRTIHLKFLITVLHIGGTFTQSSGTFLSVTNLLKNSRAENLAHDVMHFDPEVESSRAGDLLRVSFCTDKLVHLNVLYTSANPPLWPRKSYSVLARLRCPLLLELN